MNEAQRQAREQEEQRATLPSDPERQRLAADMAGAAPWKRWGSYLSERQWGTVREDYTPNGDAWNGFPHDHARSRVYRWSEDGLLGLCDDNGYLCFSLALWNEADDILKERLFGLTNQQGNHGEDVKESYYYLDNTPTHSFMEALYQYPQRPFPYADLLAESQRRSREDPEYELCDTGIFDENRFFDVTLTYAKAAPEDILIRIAVTNRGPEAAPLHLLPLVSFRNTWSWGKDNRRPSLRPAPVAGNAGFQRLEAEHPALGRYWLACAGSPELLFTENESNNQRLTGTRNLTRHVKDGFNEAIVNGHARAVSRRGPGTRAAAHYQLTLAAGATETVLLRLSSQQHERPFDAEAVESVFRMRREEADAFYQPLAPVDHSAGWNGGNPARTEDARIVQRRAFAGLLWTKQWYHYDVEEWLDGDPGQPPPPPGRGTIRNGDWRHLNNADVLSMPDSWEYPWYAAWDLAFHTIALVLVDPHFAKRQLLRMLREWYMHPNGQIPAYEWAFSDVNPPVHAWAAWRVYKIEEKHWGVADRRFLERVFHKLLINFTWWVNRKDPEGRNIFQGGFLGLDNIGLIDRSEKMPDGGELHQSDGTSWMAMFCLNMLTIALELAREESAYEDIASKFFEHFLYIAGAMNDVAGEGISLWDDEDEFFYDVLLTPKHEAVRLKVRSLVGLIPLLAVETIDPKLLERLPNFARRMDWFLTNRPRLASLVSRWAEPGLGERRLLALVRGHRMKRLLARMLDPEEFFSEHGVRSVSKYYKDHPYSMLINGVDKGIRYEPGESHTALFGGNSNWRGPVWFPINYLLIESLQKFHHYYSDDFRVECPTGSGEFVSLRQIADELSRRLITLFLPNAAGKRPSLGEDTMLQEEARQRGRLLFHEYFHGDTGAGLGASHQTGWTALVAKLVMQQGGE